MASGIMLDAAYASNIPVNAAGAVAGYLSSPNAYHAWSVEDWARFSGTRKLPVYVAGSPGESSSGFDDGMSAISQLVSLGVPVGCFVALDMETRVDKTYVTSFGHVLNYLGYKVFVYGSASTVFSNPGLNGYWVADYTGSPYMYSGARLTQYASGQEYDSSTVKFWTYNFGTWWK